ncbi:MAG: TIGR03960 family B12-binding radical SAM protein [Chloroflexi bacterium]|nr:MAG: TIGR03960 family B12-binding radical SAM protein [Chloroflexota bacterium]MBL1195631.1 TIGR03960 family B12-binding radical SAM protein [Chloroflexota bacterium]NOH12919.1 TIGR03960 family B12-binding radical SAM protein [Chloroflexota bacterium]
MPDNLSEVQRAIAGALPRVQKPARYTGGELNQTVKNWDEIQTKVCIAFPDIYDLGMSNYGTAILYDLVNQRDDALAERAYVPWTDMEAIMREEGIPLTSLENQRPLRDFDILGISLPYETLYTNCLNMLDLGGIPLFSSQRGKNDPLVIAGGHGMLNPEPMHAFLDAVVVGEGEEVLMDIIDAQQAWKKTGEPRQRLLEQLSSIWGVYVPSLYEAHYEDDGTLAYMEKKHEGAAFPIVKRIVAKLPPPTTKLIVPYIDTVHNRIPIEIMRGCTRGCRFCQAGMITRPVRERPVEEVIEALREAMQLTGFEEVGLLSLSSSDYTYVVDLVNRVHEEFGEQNLTVNLPSLRIESVSVDLMEALGGTRRSGFTLAPEAATERMRDIINKPVPTQELLDTAREIYSRGWTTIKLYFMIGHPLEDLEDVQAIADLAKAVRKVGFEEIGHKAKVNVGVSTFVPKPHTPFQWEPCDTIEQMEAKQDLLKKELRGPGLKMNWNDPDETMLEAALSRGDRRLAEVIYTAWKKGAKFDAWHEHFDYALWLEAYEEAGLDPDFYTHRPRLIDETFPWDHIDSTVRKKFLTEDYMMSKRRATRIDCRHRCFACGILPTFTKTRMEHPGEVWQCPEVKPHKDRGKKMDTNTILVEDISVN